MTEPAFRDDRRAVMNRWEGSWDRLRGRLGELAVRERAGERLGDSITLAQVMTHLARWDEVAAFVLRERLAGRDIADEFHGRDAQLNTRWLAEDVYVELDDAERRLDDAHAARRGALEALDGALWDEVGEPWTAGGTDHYESHFSDPFDFPVSREESLLILGERWEALRTRLIALAAEEQHAPGRQDVTLGQAVSHIAHWDEASAEVITARREDRSAPDPYSGPGKDREWNARWLQQDEGADPSEALDRLERASSALTEALRALDDGAWRRYGLSFTLGTAEHYRSHTEYPLEFPLPA